MAPRSIPHNDGNFPSEFLNIEENKKKEVFENPALTKLKSVRHVLLLQGPVGPFFDRITTWLQAGGAKVHRVVFQGGDHRDCQKVKPIFFHGTLSQWPDFLQDLVVARKVDCLVLFGQSRKYHAIARSTALELDVSVIVLEEGYFRPGFLTMELGGVNGYSTTMDEYTWNPHCINLKTIKPVLPIEPDITPWHFQKMAFHAAFHYKSMHEKKNQFPNYQHHRNGEPLHYASYWLRSWGRKLAAYVGDHRFQRRLFEGSTPYFMVPLQHDGDAQITHHSPFNENTDFIIRVMRSFARHAPKDAFLVFRQHPHSRGGPGHTQLIFGLATELNIRPRVHHMVEGDTPDIAQHAIGVVLINSTVGLQALERGAPLMALGEALYHKPGLTFSGELDDFWHHSRPADKAVIHNFLAQIKNLTQVPVSVYALGNEPILWAHS